MVVVLSLLVLLASYGAYESHRHRKALLRVPIRIHVNGTRGKSSVTRLIAAGLRAGGIPTVAKTTGTQPRIILEDGREIAIRRIGRPSIIEQLKVVKVAADRGARALVVECMALQPVLQRLSEQRMLASTCGVITNAREDHLDVMGPTIDHVARFLCNTLPLSGKAFVSDRRSLALFRAAAAQNGVEVVVGDANEVAHEEMRPFEYIEHRENVALALRVCEAHGIPRRTALKGMHACTPDPGALRRYLVRHYDKEIEFANAFAANDRESTLIILERLHAKPRKDRQVIILFNTRGDRIQRAEQFAGMIARDVEADRFILVGEFVDAVQSAAVRQGADPEKISNLGAIGPGEVPKIFEEILASTAQRSIVIGIGNIGGSGQEIVDFFKNRSQEAASA